MPDDILVKPATDPSAVRAATDEVGERHFQLVKLAFGADGTATLVAADSGLPVVIAAPVAVTGPLTDDELRAAPVQVTGSVTVSDGSGPLTVDGTVSVANLPAVQEVSGPLTDAELRAAPVAVQAASLPLPAGAATEATLAVAAARLPDLAGGRMPVVLPASQQTASGAVLVGTSKERFFTSFFDFDTSASGDWEVVQTGSGMAITGPLGGAVAGSTPYISISSGTTADAQTVILSRTMFSAPVELRYQISASQRIANNALRIGFVEVDPATGAVLTSTAYAAAPSVLNARNAAMAEWSGTTATTGTLLSRSAGAAVGTLANAFGTGQTTVATGSAPNWIAPTMFGLILDRDRVNTRAWTPNVLTNAGTQFAYDAVIPNPTKTYKLAIIVENGAVDPASSTDWRLHLVNVLDAARVDVSPRAGGQTDGSKAFPVNVLGGVTLAGSAARVGFIAASGIWYDDSSTTLGASATFTGTGRDATATATATPFAGTTTLAQEIRAMAEADVAGTLWLEASRDNTTWRRVRSVAATAVTGGGFAAEILYRPAWRYWRVGYTNGASAQARFTIGTIATAA